MSNLLSFCCAGVLLAAWSPSVLAQGSSLGGTAEGEAVVYTMRAAFEADCGRALPVETFDEANVARGDSTVFQGPLRAATDNAIFSRRSILYDMQVDADSADISGPLSVSHTTSVRVGNQRASHNLDLELGPPAPCLGFDVRTRTGRTVEITAFTDARAPVGSVSVSGVAEQFVGFKAAVPSGIRRVRIGTAAASERAEVDNLSFGNEGPFRVLLAARGSTTVTPGSSGRLKYTVTNQTAEPLEGGLFYQVERDGEFLVRGSVLETTWAPGQVSKVYTQPVPRSARPGAYTYALCAGPDIHSPVACSEPLVVTVEAGRTPPGR